MKKYEVVLYDKESPAFPTTIKKNVLNIKYIYWLGKWLEFDYGDFKEKYNRSRFYIGKITEYEK